MELPVKDAKTSHSPLLSWSITTLRKSALSSKSYQNEKLRKIGLGLEIKLKILNVNC